jgi:DNA-binding GntR family transcriptional regulator
MPRQRESDVYEALKREITEFKVKPGDRLLETELSARYGISRTPVREALQRLEQEGLVVAQAGGRVARHFDLREFEDMYRLRVAIEQLAVTQACERAPDSAIAQMRDAWDDWYAHAAVNPEDEYDLAEIEGRVHMGIARLSQNEILITTLARINDRIAVVRKTDFLDDGRVQETQAQHNEILEAIGARDDELARQLMKVHIEQAQANISRLLSGALAQAYLQA